MNGLHWGNDVQGAIANAPTDPADKLAFGWHVYDEFGDPNKCTTVACFNEKIAPLAEDNKIVITEFGSRLLCDPSHDENVMNFAVDNGIGFVGWAWYPADCGFPALIKDWSGVPTEAGWRLCTFLEGDCSTVAIEDTIFKKPEKKYVAGIATDTPAEVVPEVIEFPSNLPPICLISFDKGVLNSTNVTCNDGRTLSVSGTSDQTWNDRISSWSSEGPWAAIASWDYYTTSGRVEKGTELWLPNSRR